MVKAVIFDFGNVIARFDNQNFIQYLAIHTNKTPEELTRLIYPKSIPGEGQKTGLITSGFPRQYETGLITSHEFFERMKELTQADISEQEFSEIYTQDKFWPIPETLGIMRKLKRNGNKVGLLSNTSELDYELGFKPIFRRAGIEFDSTSLAYKVRALKPDERIYKHALDGMRKFGIQPEQCVYVDDIEEYAKTAETFGMRGIHFDYRKDDLVEKLREKGVKI